MKHKFFELPTGENVVKFDTYIEDKRIIGVATNATLTLLSKALSLHIDGTTKCYAVLFYILHVYVLAPVVFMLLPNKKRRLITEHSKGSRVL